MHTNNCMVSLKCMLCIAKNTLATNNAPLDQTDSRAAASSKIKLLYQNVWQCERLVPGFEVTGLITLHRDWFRYSYRGCSGLQMDGEKCRGRGGRWLEELWKEWIIGAWIEKRWRSFNFDLNKTLLLWVPLMLSLLLHQKVAVFPFSSWAVFAPTGFSPFFPCMSLILR